MASAITQLPRRGIRHVNARPTNGPARITM